MEGGAALVDQVAEAVQAPMLMLKLALATARSNAVAALDE
jgi:hypothetical protein